MSDKLQKQQEKNDIEQALEEQAFLETNVEIAQEKNPEKKEALKVQAENQLVGINKIKRESEKNLKKIAEQEKKKDEKESLLIKIFLAASLVGAIPMLVVKGIAQRKNIGIAIMYGGISLFICSIVMANMVKDTLTSTDTLGNLVEIGKSCTNPDVSDLQCATCVTQNALSERIGSGEIELNLCEETTL